MGPSYVSMDNVERTLGLIQFDGNDFSAWKFRFEALLDEKDLLEHMKKPADEELLKKEDWLKNDKKAKSFIIKCVANSHIDYLRDKQFAYQMWEALQEAFERKSSVSRLFMLRKLLNTSYDESEPFNKYFMKFEQAVRDLKNAGRELVEADVVDFLLISLPSSYDNVVSALENLEESKLTLETVKARLLEEEMKRKFKTNRSSHGEEEPENSAFGVNKGGHRKFMKPRKIRCYGCNEYGHKKPDCPKLKSTANAEKNGNEGFNMVILRTINAMSVDTEGSCMFVVDSGCTDHMVNDKSYLVDVRKLANPFHISVADKETKMTVNFAGHMKVSSVLNEKEFTGTINNVLYVPELRYNLLSVSKIESNGGKVLFENGKASIYLGGKLIGEAKRNGSLYWFPVVPNSHHANVSVPENELWHRRLGHLSMENVCKLKKLALGLPEKLSSKMEYCECCKVNKITRKPFVGTRIRASRPLERVHSDICGHINPPTYNGYRYFVTFTDEFTHLCVVYLLRKKSELFDKFKEYHAMATAHFNLCMGELRVDNGGEYLSGKMKEFCREKGVILNPTTPYTPENNGISERMNRTLVEKARSMLSDAKLPKHLWGEAVLTAVYLTNRSTTKALPNATPYEMWHGRKPELSKLRIFGSPAVMHIPKEKRQKLDQTGTPAVLVGYGMNGYRLWRSDLQKVVTSRDVFVNEQKHAVVLEEETDVMNEPLQDYSKPIETDDEESDNEHDTGVSNEDKDETIIPKENTLDTPDPNSSIYETPQAPSSDDRPKRNVQPPRYLDDYELYIATALSVSADIDDVPLNFSDIENRSDKAEWHSSVNEELQSLEKNNTWKLAKLPKGAKLIGTKWVFRRKLSDDGNGYKCRARLVAKGFMQREGVDYTETYAPVARLPTVRLLFALSIQMNFSMIHLDVRTAFLHGNLDEEIYLKAPEGVKVPNGQVLQLLKSLYGLKQSPKCWNTRFHTFMIKIGFTRSKADYCLYWLKDGATTTFVVLYVDDMLICYNDEAAVTKLKSKLFKEFEMKDLGPVKNFMGLQIVKENNQLYISQSSFIDRILAKFGMSDCNPIATPMEAKLKLTKAESNEFTNQPYRELLGSLMYLMIGSRPDICFSLNYLSRFQDKASEHHWNHLKRILRYLKGTKNHQLVYKQHETNPVEVYTDSDFANDPEDCKSTSGFVIKIFGNTVIWSSKKQSLVALSSTEAEYIAACSAVCELLWVLNVLDDLNIKVPRPIPIYEDNSACIMISKNLATKRTRHYKTKLMFLRELSLAKKIELVPISTKDQPADTLTKSLPREPFERFRKVLGLEVGEGVGGQ